MKVEGKVAMVTGGARGIGKAICAGLLEEGAKGVCIVDNRTAEGTGTASELCAKHEENRAIYVNTDVTADDQFEAAFVKTKDQYGRLDIVINNAAIIDIVNYRRMVDVNLTAVITGTMLALKYMGKCHGFDGGIVVNVSSIGGLTPLWYIPAYAGTKFGVVGFSRSIALVDSSPIDGGYGVRVNVVCPSATKTDLPTEIVFPSEEVKRRTNAALQPVLDQQMPPEVVWKSTSRLIADDSLNGACLLIRHHDGETLHYPGDDVKLLF